MEHESEKTEDREQRLQEVLVRYVDALEDGHPPDLKEFTARYPEFAADLEEYFAGLRQLDQLAGALRGLVPPSATRQLGDFRLLREVGRGGMGIVYEAEQLSLDRRVALKVLSFAAVLDSKQLRRFQNEAQAAAHLHHQNIVPVYAVGCERGVHYFAMQFIDGQTLDALLRDLRQRAGISTDEDAQAIKSMTVAHELPTPPRARIATEAPPTIAKAGSTQPNAALSTARPPGSFEYYRMVARWGIQVAEALEHAHELGIIHRDIKPSNLIVDVHGHLWVTDFGLARYQTDLGLTLTGDLVGTLRYMSPEQALAKRGLVDHRTDIYSLGVTLYELLTFQPAISGQDRQELLRNLAFHEPLIPTRLCKGIPADLETIVLKAMAKEVEGRYSTARECAEDLQRYLADRPILAKRVTLVHRLRRWLGRHKALTAGVTGMLLLATVGLAISTILIWEKEEQTREALAESQISQRKAEEQKFLAEQREQLARRYLYAADLNLAYQAWDSGQVARTLRLLEQQRPGPGQQDLRGFEWHHLLSVCGKGRNLTLRGHSGPVVALACSADGKRLASGGEDGAAWLWDMSSGQGRALIRASQTKIKSVAFAAGGQTLMLAQEDGTLIAWDVAKDKARSTIHTKQASLTSMAISPDAQQLAVAIGAGIEVWDLGSAKLLAILREPDYVVYTLSFSPDGQTLAFGNNDGSVRLWKAPFGGPPVVLGSHRVYALSVSFSLDGRKLASAADDGSVMVWDLASLHGSPAQNLHAGSAHAVAFFPDSQRLISCGEDGTVQMWQVGAKERLVRGCSEEIHSLSLTADGQTLATGQADGTISLWRVAEMQTADEAFRHGQTVNSIALSPDNRTLASAGGSIREGGWIKLWDVVESRETASWRASSKPLHGLCFSPDGQLLASAGDEGTIQLWEAATHRLIMTLPGHAGGTWCAAFSPDGSTLATAGYGNHIIKLWKVSTGQSCGELHGHQDRVWTVAFSPDGQSLASGSRDNTARIWKLADPQQPTILTGHDGWVWSLAFSPDGKTLATASQDRTVRLWNASTGQRTAVLSGHTTFVRAVAFFPDGRTLATGSDDQTVKIWDLETHQERATLRGHVNKVSSLAVTTDGRCLISGSWDGTVRLWRAPAASELDSFFLPHARNK